MGDEALAREIEALFLETVNEQLTSIRASVRGGGAGSLEAKLHKLKGTLANLGAERCVEAAGRAETAVLDAQCAVEAVEALLAEVDALRREMLSVRQVST